VTVEDPARILARVDGYLHLVPLSGARAHEIDRFTLFRSTTAWSYYARPRPPEASGPTTDFTATDIERLWTRCRELRVPLSLEWVHQLAPSLAGAAVAAGLVVVEHPLLVLRPADFRPAAGPAGVSVEIVAADRTALVTARAVADVAFGVPGTQVGEAGAGERDGTAAKVGAARGNALLERTRNGVTVTAVALRDDGRPIASGQHQPVGTVTEVVAVATLPAFRRRGLAAAVTSLLVTDAFERGVDLVMLSAQNDDVARIYERLGFARIGSVAAAEPPDLTTTGPT
jgi:ribosomal protein S18 acetylase RimI-like enzyme